MLTSQAQWNPKGLGVEVEEGNFAGSSSGRSGLAIGCRVAELPKNKLAWLGLTMRPLKKRTIIMKCKEASLVKSLDAGRRGGNERRDRRRGMRPEVGADERREVGEKCQLAGHIRRQAQMRQPKADSLAHLLILNAQALRWDRRNRRIHDHRPLPCAQSSRRRLGGRGGMAGVFGCSHRCRAWRSSPCTTVACSPESSSSCGQRVIADVHIPSLTRRPASPSLSLGCCPFARQHEGVQMSTSAASLLHGHAPCHGCP